MIERGTHHVGKSLILITDTTMGLDIFFLKRNKKNHEESTELAYFRKVNFLVRFFNDRDDDFEGQTPLTLTREDITDLKEACEAILSKAEREYGYDEKLPDDLRRLAEEHLPTMAGFFFGSTAYDGSYLNSVSRVSGTCDRLLEEYDAMGEDEEIVFVTWY